MRKGIICCGNVAFDLIAGKDTPGGMVFHARPGGSVLNTALQLRRLGLPVSILSKTGNDFFADALLKIVKAARVRADFVIRDKKQKTGLAFALINKKGDSSYLFYKPEGEKTAFTSEQLSPRLFENAAVFHTASNFSYGDFTFENTLTLMAQAKKQNVFISYDPNWRESQIKNKQNARKRIKKLFEFAGLLKLSHHDAVGITDTKTLSSALCHLPSNIFVTLGKKGSFFWDGKKKIFQPAFKVATADTIGAGDAFTSALIYKFCLEGKQLFWEKKKENLKFASAVSALVCTGKGAIEGLKNVQQVEKFLNV
ncbi:MAG: carbohydrate kinase [Candidatus Omnitrophota bacterium]